MAQGKKSFVAYSDWDGMFKALPDEVAGKLIKHIFSYVNDQNPSTEDYVINALFEQIKATLKRDLVKWEQQTEQRKSAGLRSAEIRKRNSTTVNERSISSTDNVNVNDNVSVTVNDNDILLKKETKRECFTFDEFWSLYPKKVAKEICGKKYESLSANDKQKIKETLPNFILHKPFKDYTHPNPSTYLNQKRWNDEINTTVKKEDLKFSVNFQHPDSKLIS